MSRRTSFESLGGSMPQPPSRSSSSKRSPQSSKKKSTRSNSIFSYSQNPGNDVAGLDGALNKSISMMRINKGRPSSPTNTYSTRKSPMSSPQSNRMRKTTGMKNTSGSALTLDIGNNRAHLHAKTMNALLRHWIIEYDNNEDAKVVTELDFFNNNDEDTTMTTNAATNNSDISDPIFLNTLPFHSILLPRHKSKLPYLYKAYSTMMNERIGNFDIEHTRSELQRNGYNLNESTSSRQEFLDELLDLPECLSFLDEFWRVIHHSSSTNTINIPIGGRLPHSSNYQIFHFFHESLSNCFPYHRGSDNKNSESDWLVNATAALPEGWNGATTEDGGLEWKRETFEKQLLTIIVEVLCEGTRSPSKFL